MRRAQILTMQILADGPARQSNRTDPKARTVSWRTVRVLEQQGLVIDVAGYKALLTDAGRDFGVPDPEPYQYEHGTHACYTIDGCRCLPCRSAHTTYETKRVRDNAYRRPRQVAAEPVRAHVRSLMAPRKGSSRGMGWKRIAETAGVPTGTVWKLLYGVPSEGRPPSRRVRVSTADALLAVTEDLADGATVPAKPTRKMLDAMVAGGFCKAELGRYVTGNPAAKSLQVATSRYVQVGTAEAVNELHRRWQAGEIVPRGKRSRHEHGPPSPFPATPGPPACEDCGADPWLGGRWCWDHYQQHRRAA